MGREIRMYPPVSQPEAVFEQIKMSLSSLGFEYVNYEGEMVFKKGHGILTGPNFLKITFLNEGVKAEGWLKFALLPGVYFGEIDLKSPIGFAAKSGIKNGLASIESILNSHYLANNPQSYYNAPQAVFPPPAQQPIYNNAPIQQPYCNVPSQQPVYNAPVQQSTINPPAPQPLTPQPIFTEPTAQEAPAQNYVPPFEAKTNVLPPESMATNINNNAVFCSRCGAPASPQSAFCSKCGNSLKN